MWLLKAVGVHDQLDFTFALERGRTYTIGRDKSCNIQFTSKRLRLHEGTLEVGEWMTTDPFKKPFVKYRPEAKKNKKEFPPYKTVLLSEEAAVGSTTLGDYEIVTLDDGSQGAFLSDHDGQGIHFDDDAWFTLYWKDLNVVWSQMKDETDELRETLKSYCIPWTPSFETDHIPDLVFSPTFKPSMECNYACCYGVRILQPEYLRDIVRRLGSCWKPRADAEDSFRLPDTENEKYRPTFDTTLQAFRCNYDSWNPDPRRPTIFKGWKILVLRSKQTPGERRYLMATGAELTDCDVITQPLLSAADMETRMSAWLAEVDAHEGGRERAVVAHFGTVKRNLTESGKDFSVCVEAPCHRLGLAVAPGSIIWHALRLGGVRRYLEEAATNVPRGKFKEAAASEEPAPRATRRTQVPETSTAPPINNTREPTPAAEPSSAGPSQSSGSPSQTRSFVPGSQPDETSSKKGETSEPMEVEQIEAPPSAQPSSTTRRALKRRVGKPMADLYVEPIAETPLAGIDSGENSSQSQEKVSEPPAAQQPPPSQSYIPDSVAPSQTQSAAMGRSRLKRRAGTQQPLVDYTIPESSVGASQDMRPEIQEVYEQAMQSRSDRQPPPKRARLASVDEGGSADPSREATPASTLGGDGMDLDGDGEEQLDFVEKTLRQAAKAKKEGRHPSGQLMPPPAQIPNKTKTTRQRTTRSPSEESEQLEEPPRKSKRAQSPVKQSIAQSTKAPNGTAHPPATQDKAFLQAIAKNAKSRKAIDELDKEFNQLRIPKPGANPGTNVVKASAWDASHPDWNIVNDFDDEMRGNFIEIIRVDLMRKDGGRKEPAIHNDGRPNFKKFKKKDIVRRDPVRMVLAAPTSNDPEMGEPYWPTQQATGRRGKGATQAAMTQYQQDEEDDEMPLLPTSRRRLLDNDQDDDMTPTPSTSRGRTRGAIEPDSQVTDPGRSATARIPRATQRKTREASIASDVSSAGVRSSRTSKTSRPAAKASASSAKGGRGTAIVIEESEDEVNRDIGPARSSTGTRGRSMRNAGTSEAGPSASGRIADDEATTLSGIKNRTQSTLGATGRRRLLVADDDDDGEMNYGLTKKVFKGAAKKRRI